jgi:AcrR family transcriptional regulator
VLAAAGEVLFDEGMAGFTIDKVASRSGASKMTLYKWWPSKGALALDGYFKRVEPELAFPDTGDIEADLRNQLHAFLRVIRDSPAGPAIAELIGQAQTDPELKAAYLERYSSPRRALAVAAMTEAKQRGQLRANLDPEAVVDQLWGACYHRLLVPDLPLTSEFVDALVDNLFGGIRP